MSKLVYGKNGQVRFNSLLEKQEAMEYLATSEDIKFRHENNEEQGAWASEKRILFYKKDGVPAGLVRNWSAGTGKILGRINAADLYDEVLQLRAGK